VSEAPICPKHGYPMRAGNRPGNFYCSRQDPEGPKGYCIHRVNLDARTQGGNVAETVQRVVEARAQQATERRWDPVQQETSSRAPHALTWEASDARARAALEFAGRIYSGAGGGQELEAQALNLAERALLMFERKP